MSGKPKIARRIVLRLDPNSARDDASLAAAISLARAFNAELAARLVSDTRLVGALTAPIGSTRSEREQAFSIDLFVRRAEATFRRSVSSAADREQTAWSFATVQCAGILSDCADVEPEDVVALDARFDGPAGDLRREVHSALSRARGALLFPSQAPLRSGPIVVTSNDGVTEIAERIASALDLPLLPFKQGEARTAADFASAARRRHAALAVIDAAEALAQEFIARPRFLRELDAPLLLLKRP